MVVHPLVKEIIISEEEINKRCKELGEEISAFYTRPENKIKDNTILCLGLLKGCIPFMAKFICNLSIECETNYMVVSLYFGGIKGNRIPKILLDISISVNNRDILLVEDIIDSGKTIKLVKDYLLSKGAKSLRVVTLLDKKAGREIDLIADWYGFNVPHTFLIGFGLDYEERLRNLPYVAIADCDKIKTWKWDN